MDLPPASEACRQATEIAPKAPHPAFPKLLERVGAHVRKAAAVRHTSTVFSIPTALFGVPLYRMDDALEFVGSELTLRGYSVTSHGGGVLAISWHAKEDAAATSRAPDLYDITI
jgi:hypothetical protein